MGEMSIFSVDEEIISKIRKLCGTPAYIFDEYSFSENLDQFISVFRNHYEKFHIAYSFKTNYTPYICSIVRSKGEMAEVVSDFEYYLARRIGFPDNRIIFNGPLKKAYMETHLLKGGIVNIDHPQDAMRIVQLAQQHPDDVVRVGIRMNIDIDQGYVSRFGLDETSREFENTLSQLSKYQNIYLCGLHCHIGKARSLHNWELRCKRMLEAADRIFSAYPPQFLDLGGNMHADMEQSLKAQFSEEVPSYKAYAELIGSMFSQHYKAYPPNERPYLYLEPGTPLICRYMWLLTSVVSHKTIQGKQITGVDSCIFEAGEMSTEKHLPIRILNHKPDFIAGDIVGYTCLDFDVLSPDCRKPAAIGDSVLIGDAGSYSFVFKPPFIYPDIPIVVIRQDHTLKIIKKRQTYDDLIEQFVF